jgi:hypothetical protein
VSAGIFTGKHTSAIVLQIAEENTIVLSSQIIDELYEVVALKFPDKKPALERFLKRLSYEIAYTPVEIDDDIAVKPIVVTFSRCFRLRFPFRSPPSAARFTHSAA